MRGAIVTKHTKPSANSALLGLVWPTQARATPLCYERGSRGLHGSPGGRQLGVIGGNWRQLGAQSGVGEN